MAGVGGSNPPVSTSLFFHGRLAVALGASSLDTLDAVGGPWMWSAFSIERRRSRVSRSAVDRREPNMEGTWLCSLVGRAVFCALRARPLTPVAHPHE